MPLIEGLGDEVTFVLAAFLLCVVLLLAWFSTHTADIPLLREMGVIVVELSQRRTRAAAAQRSGPEGEEGGLENAGRETSVSPSAESPVQPDDGNQEDGQGSQRDDSSSSPQPQYAGNSELSSSVDISVQGASSETMTLPEAAELVSAGFDAKDQHDKLKDNGRDDQGRTDSLSYPASVTVNDDQRPDRVVEFLSEEEVRRRRVQYFQTGPSTHLQSISDVKAGIGGESNSKGHSLTTERREDDSLQNSSPSTESHNSNHQTSPGEGLLPRDLTDNNTPVSLLSTEVSPEDTILRGQGSVEDGENSRIRVKLKYMNETQRLVYASPYDTIGNFRRAHFQSELDDNKWVRFIYNGQDLRDDARTLHACNIGDNCTMHCLITAQTRDTPASGAAHDEEDDTLFGAMMYPLFSLVLMVVWYFRFTYRQYFSAMSTVCLIGITFLLALSYISSLRGNNRQQQQETGGAPHPHAD